MRLSVLTLGRWLGQRRVFIGQSCNFVNFHQHVTTNKGVPRWRMRPGPFPTQASPTLPHLPSVPGPESCGSWLGRVGPPAQPPGLRKPAGPLPHALHPTHPPA